MIRRTKIVATIGPASQDEESLQQLIEAGMNVARVNFSHGNHQLHGEVIQRIRSFSKMLDRPVTILQDLQGPKIRTGEIKDGQVELIPGRSLKLTTESMVGDEKAVSVDFPQLPDCVEAGNRILLDDGSLELQVTGISQDCVHTQVVVGGTLKPHKGVNLPGARLEIPGFTDKDAEDLRFGLDQEIDMVAVSFVRTALDIQNVREAIANHAPKQVDTQIIAKLERREALDNLDEILHAADGVMVARGDLGVEMSPESVPIAQKRIIDAANQHAKLVITATQMLDSMIQNPRPTRAEASDVANAIFDGTDAAMLSGETAVGQYPVKSIEMMNAIITQAEAHSDEWGHCLTSTPYEHAADDAYYMTLAARELAHDRNVTAIAVFTKSGRSALLMSKARPDVPILAFTPNPRTFSQMGLFWGVIPHLVPHADTIEDMLKVVEQALITSTSIQPGQQVILICGFPVYSGRASNLALLHTVGEKFHT